MKNQIQNTVFYHIYPLGMTNAPFRNDFSSPKSDRLLQLVNQLEQIKDLGVNAIYIGPLFESSSHGYDTVDYYHVDRRLGNNQDFVFFTEKCHEKGINVIVDAVFNHTGRDFFAFKDIQEKGPYSPYSCWYKNINFDQKSPYGDNFTYEGWAGCMDLVKLDVDNFQVRDHIFKAVEKWIKDFHIDGLRLDAADVLSPDFLDELKKFTSSLKEDFWLMGEVVHGDYNNWVKEGRLDSVTNYQLYKGMWSSYNSANMFEVAWSLNEEFGPEGRYKFLKLYNFLDNHDVNRLASTVEKQEYLFPLYGMLFTVPGVPSIYYGSEFGLKGSRNADGDFQLRPALPPFTENLEAYACPEIKGEDLKNTIKRFAKIRASSMALRMGDYKQLAVTNTCLAFKRTFFEEEIIAAFNQSGKEDFIKINGEDGQWEDILNGGKFSQTDLNNLSLPKYWLRILRKIK